MSEPEVVQVQVRLVGDVTGTVYASQFISAETIFKDPDLYLGFADLAIPFYPVHEGAGHEGSGPKLDPKDNNVLIQMRTASDGARIGARDGEGSSGHWRGVLVILRRGRVEIPSGLVD